jgi:hypothetical protein
MNTVLKRTVVAMVASLGLGILFDYFFFEKLPGVAFPIYIALVLVGIAFTARKYKTELSFQAHLLMLPILFFASMVAVSANGFVTFLNVVTSLYLMGLLLYAVFAPKVRDYTSANYVAPARSMPGKVYSGLLETSVDIANHKQFLTKHKALPQVLRGIAITVPVLIVFVALFASADLVFRKYVTDIFSLNLNGELVARTLLVLLVATVALGVFGYLSHSPKSTEAGENAKKKKRFSALFGSHGNIEVTILLGSLSVLFLCFLSVQLTYLFGGLENITNQGFTYAEYARKGFFELIFVAALTFLLVLGSEKVMLRGKEQHSRAFKILSSVLVLEVMVMMGSAFKRLSLYESAYGFTTLRVLSHIFILWLVVVFGILLYKIIVNHRENTFAFLSFLSVLALLAFINVFNVDSFVARKNIGRYYDTGKLDVSYLGSLSHDATPEIVKLLDKPGTHKQDLIGTLSVKKDELREIDDWQSANISRSAALTAIEAREEIR